MISAIIIMWDGHIMIFIGGRHRCHCCGMLPTFLAKMLNICCWFTEAMISFSLLSVHLPEFYSLLNWVMSRDCWDVWLGDSGLVPLWAPCLWLLPGSNHSSSLGLWGLAPRPRGHGHTSSSLGPCCHGSGLLGFRKLLLSQSKVSLLWKISLHCWSVTQWEGAEESHVSFFREATSIVAAWLSRALPEVSHRQEVADCLS